MKNGSYLGVSCSEVVGIHSDAEKGLVGGGLVVSAAISEDLGSDDRITHQKVRVHNLNDDSAFVGKLVRKFSTYFIRFWQILFVKQSYNLVSEAFKS